jgi:hypothetical protein
MVPKLSQMISLGISTSSVPIENNDRAISDQTATTSSPRTITILRELKSTVKTFANERPRHLLPQMRVNGTDRRRFPEKSVHDGCRGYRTGIESPPLRAPRGHVDGGFHVVRQDDELRRPAVIMAAKAHDVDLSHGGRQNSGKVEQGHMDRGLRFSFRMLNRHYGA